MRGRLRAAWLVLAALLVFAAVVLWMLPAEIAVRMAADRLQPLQLDGVSGTAWHGRARRASLFGQTLGAVEWRLAPLPLLLGRTVTDVRVEGPDLRASAHLSEAGERVEVTGLQAEFPAGRLEPALGVPALSLGGRVVLEDTDIALDGGVPRATRGRGVWREASVAGAANAELGDIRFEFAGGGAEPVRGSIADAGGPLQVAGGFVFAMTGYTLDLTLRARGDQPAVRDALRWLGQPQADGSTRLLVEGGLRPW